MSHTINLYVLKASSNVAKLSHLPHVVENGYILLPLSDQVVAELGVDYMDDDYQKKAEHKLLQSCPDMAWVETDYFGGMGEQDAKAWVNRIPHKEDDSKHMTINKALKAIGVEKADGMDEYDTINLGNYRSNQAVISEWEEVTGKTTEMIIRRLLLKQIPKEMTLFWTEERIYTTPTDYICMFTFANSNDHPKKYYRCKTNHAQTVTSENPMVLEFKETRVRTTDKEFYEALPNAISHVKIDYIKDTIYNFIKYEAYPSDMGVKHVTTFCAVEYECDHLGVAELHEQVKAQTLMYDDKFQFGPYEMGRNGKTPVYKTEPKKPKLVKRTVEVYVCPECDQGDLIETDGMHCCNVCTFKADMTEV